MLQRLAAAAIGFAATIIAIPALSLANTAIILGGGMGPSFLPVPGNGAGGNDITQLGANWYPSANVTKVVLSYPNGVGIVSCPSCPSTGDGVRAGTTMLDQAIHQAEVNDPNGHIYVIGVSEGAMVMDAEQARLLTDPNAPPAGKVTFIEFGDPNRGILRYLPPGTYLPYPVDITTSTPVASQYNTIVVTDQYDGWSDPPTNRLNLLADVNAIMGMYHVHPHEGFSSPSQVPPQDITVVTNANGSTTTYYLVPTQQLPLTEPLRAIFPAATVDALDNAVRPVIDAGYSSPAPVPAPTVQMPKVSVLQVNSVAAVTSKVTPAVGMPKVASFKLDLPQATPQTTPKPVLPFNIGGPKVTAVAKPFELPKINGVPKVDAPKVDTPTRAVPAAVAAP